MHTKFIISLSLLIALFAAGQVSAQDDKTYQSYQDKKGLWGFQEIKSDYSYGGETKYPVRVKAQFDAVAEEWFNGLCAVKKNGSWGYVNMKGKLIVPFLYEEATGKYVKLNGKWGAIDEKGNLIVPCQYDEVKGKYVKMDGKWGIIDNQGNSLMPCTYPYLTDGGVLNIASLNGKQYGYVDDSGKILIPFMYEECFPMRGGTDIVKTATGYEMKSSSARAKVKLNGRYGLIDINNNYVLYPVFKDLQDHFQYGTPYIPISRNGTDYGVADRNGNILMPSLFRIKAYIDRDGTAEASAPHYNDGQASSGQINVVQQTYKDNKNTHTYSNIPQNYLSRQDSATLRLFRADWIKRYQAAPNDISGGYLAYQIASDFLLDTLSKETSRPEGINWLQKGIDVNHDLLCAVDLSEILFSGAYDVAKDESKGFSLLLNTMTAIADNELLIESYDNLEDDEYNRDFNFEMLAGGFYSLADCYMKGTGTGKDEEKAVQWYEKGAYFGNTLCEMTLADLLYNGSGTVAQNQALALRYYERAAESLHSEAMYKAASMYLDGIGAAKDREKAIVLLKKAASLYHAASKNLLAKLGEN